VVYIDIEAYIKVKELRRVIKNGQSKETGNIGYKRRRKTKQKHNTICRYSL